MRDVSCVVREMDYEDECDRVFKEYTKRHPIQRYSDSPPHVSLTPHELYTALIRIAVTQSDRGWLL